MAKKSRNIISLKGDAAREFINSAMLDTDGARYAHALAIGLRHLDRIATNDAVFRLEQFLRAVAGPGAELAWLRARVESLKFRPDGHYYCDDMANGWDQAMNYVLALKPEALKR